MKEGSIDVPLAEMAQNPSLHKGKLFILGGIIVKTTVVQDGSLVEAIYVPVNSRGYLKNVAAKNGRFLAIFKGKEILDPLLFSEKREITFAGEFIGTRESRLDERDYQYPLFNVKEIFLWQEIDYRHYYSYPPYYPSWYYPYYQPYYPWW
jgi:outer membrane lipoprotein